MIRTVQMLFNASIIESLLLILLSVSAFAQVQPAPSLMNFQGRLSKPDGTPVANGNYSVRFSLWTAATGGTEKWNQTINLVVIRNGTFAVLLNTSTGAADKFHSNLFLEIKIGTNPPLTPRHQVVSVAYAMKADSVKDGSVTSTSIANGTITAADLASNALNSLAWRLDGNSSVTSGFLGTTDANPLIVKANNIERLRVDNNGAVGFGLGTYLDIGFGVSNRESNAGKIAYGLFTPGALDIVGAGTPLEPRKVKIWAEGGLSIPGPVNSTGLTVTGANSPVVHIQSNHPTGLGLLVSGISAIHASGSDYGVYAVTHPSWGIGVYCQGPNYAIRAFGQAAGTTGWGTVSDRRYKHHIASLPNALDAILTLRGVMYEWKREDFKEMQFAPGRQIGFIAQEVESVFPEVVYTDASGYKSVVYASLVPVLVEAIKEQQKQREADIKQMQTKLDQKDVQIAELKERLDALATAVAELITPRK